MDGFSININHVFFWNVQKVWKFNVAKMTDKDAVKQEISRLHKFRVSPDEKLTKIKQVTTGIQGNDKKKETIVIEIKQSKS